MHIHQQISVVYRRLKYLAEAEVFHYLAFGFGHQSLILSNLYTVNCHQGITQVCNHEDDSDSSKKNPPNSKFKSEVRIQLDSNSVLSAPSGVYATVQFHLRLLESFRV